MKKLSSIISFFLFLSIISIGYGENIDTQAISSKASLTTGSLGGLGSLASMNALFVPAKTVELTLNKDGVGSLSASGIASEISALKFSNLDLYSAGSNEFFKDWANHTGLQTNAIILGSLSSERATATRASLSSNVTATDLHGSMLVSLSHPRITHNGSRITYKVTCLDGTGSLLGWRNAITNSSTGKTNFYLDSSTIVIGLSDSDASRIITNLAHSQMNLAKLAAK